MALHFQSPTSRRLTRLSTEGGKKRKMTPSATSASFAPARHRTSGDATRATPATRTPRAASHPSRFRIPRAHTLNLTYISFLRSLILRSCARSNARRRENTRRATRTPKRVNRSHTNSPEGREGGNAWVASPKWFTFVRHGIQELPGRDAIIVSLETRSRSVTSDISLR